MLKSNFKKKRQQEQGHTAQLPTGGKIRYCLLFLVIAAGYAALGKLGLSFIPEGTDVSPLWPPSGFATAVLFLLGKKYWLAITVGSIAGNALIGYFSPVAIAMIACVNTLEGILAAALLRRFNFAPQLARVRDLVVFFCTTVFGSTVVAATLGTAVIYWNGELAPDAVGRGWLVFWIANATANLTIAPLLLTWASRATTLVQTALRRKWMFVEATIILSAVLFMTYGIWWSQFAPVISKLYYITFPVVMWTALRFGSRATAAVILFISLAAVLGTSSNLGPFALFPVYTSLFMVQTYMLVYALTGLLVSAIAEDSAAAKEKLDHARDNLELIVGKRTEDLRRSNGFLEAIIDNVSSAIIVMDAQGRIARLNQCARDVFPSLENFSTQQNWAKDFSLFGSDGHTPLPERDWPSTKVFRGETISNMEVVLLPPSGDPRTMLISGRRIDTDEEQHGGAVLVAHDISHRRYAAKLERLFHQAAVTANEAPDVEQAVLSILEQVCTFTEWPIGHALNVEDHQGQPAAVSTDWWYMSDTRRLNAFQEASSHRFFEGDDLPGRVLATGKPEYIDVAGNSNLPRLARLGSPVIVSAVAFPIMAESRLVAILEFFVHRRAEPDPHLLEIMEYVCTQLGRVYERHEHTQRLMNTALRDPLTGVPNRVAFKAELKQALAHAKRRKNYSFAVLFMDLDRFKIINDSLGHAAGDELLKVMTERIQGCLREGDSMARLGGDEFTVLLDDLGQRSDGANAAKVAQRINAEISRPLLIQGEQVAVSSSIGIVLSSPDYADADAMLRDADAAMYRAKAAGKSRVEIFSPDIHAEAMSQLRIETDLRLALEKNQLQLHYQPIIELQSGELVGFEALVRWEHPEQGLLLPLEFLPVCEESGLMIPLGQWTLEEACRWLSQLEKKIGRPDSPITVNVNISGTYFSSGALVHHVREALSGAMLGPGLLKLEIVENTLVRNPKEAVDAMESLRSLGVEVMIDDFGTGYSSLSYLSRLPIDALKIDRSFVHDLNTDINSAEVIRCITSLAAALNLSVVAEGIETRDQSEALQKLGCDFGQGYFYSKPLIAETAIELAVAAILNRASS